MHVNFFEVPNNPAVAWTLLKTIGADVHPEGYVADIFTVIVRSYPRSSPRSESNVLRIPELPTVVRLCCLTDAPNGIFVIWFVFDGVPSALLTCTLTK